MRKWLNRQGEGVESERGFVLQRIHRYYYHYIEDDHIMVVYVEPFTDNGKYFETILLSSFREWQPPYNKELLADDKIATIINNVDEAITFMGLDHEFH